MRSRANSAVLMTQLGTHPTSPAMSRSMGPRSPPRRLYPFLGKLTERVILFKHDPIGRADYQELVTVNGTVTPTIPIRPGEAQFWEMGHIGADRFLKVKLEGMPF